MSTKTFSKKLHPFPRPIRILAFIVAFIMLVCCYPAFSTDLVSLNPAGHFLKNNSGGAFSAYDVELVYVNCTSNCWTDPTYAGIDPASFLAALTTNSYLYDVLDEYIGDTSAFDYAGSIYVNMLPCYPAPKSAGCIGGFTNGKGAITGWNIGNILGVAAAGWRSKYPNKNIPLPIFQLVFPSDKIAVCPDGAVGGSGTGCNDCSDALPGDSCDEWIGAHDVYILATGEYAYYSYSVIPIIQPYQFGSTTSAAHQLFSNLSHELVETITDPLLDAGWAAYGIANRPEIADLCQGQMHLIHLPPLEEVDRHGLRTLNYSYWIQEEWSNELGGCM